MPLPYPMGPIHHRHRSPDRQPWGSVTIDLDRVSEDGGHLSWVPLRAICPLFWIHGEILLACKNQRTHGNLLGLLGFATQPTIASAD